MTKERRRCPVRHLRWDLGESTAHILQMKKANAVEDRDTAFYNRAYEEHKRPQRWTAKISGLHRRRLQRSARPRRAVLPQGRSVPAQQRPANIPRSPRSCSNS
ncbi:hypothetical protein [Bilophila wadsworthia]|uniref:hypothetical protein n=1 Tax=Bilophila wadsworthia TaxID=35833 RepID=UPI0039908630